jgi:hypothetical protein
MKFEADLPHCVRNKKEKNLILFKFRCNVFIGVTIIKEMPGLVASGTPCRSLDLQQNGWFLDQRSSLDLLKKKSAVYKVKDVCRRVWAGKRYLNKKTQFQKQ